MAQFVDPIISIENWYALAQESPNDGIISLLQTSGNSFPLTLDATQKAAKRLHIYLALNDEKIYFFVIRADLDQKSNKNFASSGTLIALDATQQTMNNDSNSELVTWINNWCNATMRDNWLSSAEGAVQVLVIHTTDFIVGDLHNCYLALKPGATKGSFAVDLVIKNTVTNQFLNVELPQTDAALSTGPVFADMARPVPPFGQEGHASTDLSNFGIINAYGLS